MRNLWLHALTLLAGASVLPAQPFSHEIFDGVVQAHVDSVGMVDYTGLKAHPEALAAYVDSLSQISPHSRPERFPARSHELAYWVNAYNALVLWGVVDNYPVKSVKDIGILSGFFNRHEFRVGGEKLTLNDIENKIIRPVYRDPRIHFAINCGAFSCPALWQHAYDGADLESQLQEAVRRFASDPKYVRLDAEGRLHLSKILEWYGSDFVEWFPADRRSTTKEPTVVEYLLPYLPAATAARLREEAADVRTVFNDYDWALNDRVAAK